MTIAEVSEKYNISQDALRYYEKVGMIPKVSRTKGGIRDYQAHDCSWLELVLCMRNAGLPVEVVIEYRRLYEEGEGTIPLRLELLEKQRKVLEQQKDNIGKMLDRLDYKIEKYKEAVKTGTLNW